MDCSSQSLAQSQRRRSCLQQQLEMDVAAVRHNTPGIRHGNGRIHLAAASSSLPPTAVSAAVSTQIEAEVLLGGHCADVAAQPAREDAYNALAALLHCKPEEVALLSGAAEGWRAALHCLNLTKGDRILLSAAEGDAARIACIAACAGTGAVVELLPTVHDGFPDLRALEDTIDYDVKLVALSHIAPGHGVAIPVAAVGTIARMYGVPLLLDATQTIGQLELDVEALHVDMVVASGSSYLRGPRGTGLLYINSRRMQQLPTMRAADASTAMLVPGGKGGAGMSIVHSNTARRFETQHHGIAADVGLGVAARYADAVSIKAAAKCIAKLASKCRAKLSAIRGVELLDRGSTGAVAGMGAAKTRHTLSPDPNATTAHRVAAANSSSPSSRKAPSSSSPAGALAAPGGAVQTGIVPFVCNGVEPADVARQLARMNIVISVAEMRPLEHASAGPSAEGSNMSEQVLQIAVHYYNTGEEIELVCNQIADIIDAEDPNLDEWEEVDCPLSPIASKPSIHSHVTNAAFGHGFDGASEASTSASILAARSSSKARTTSVSSSDSSDTIAEEEAEVAEEEKDGGAEKERPRPQKDAAAVGPASTFAAAGGAVADPTSDEDEAADYGMDGLGGLGASVVHDERSWGANTRPRSNEGNGIHANGSAAAEMTRTVLFPLLAGIPRRGLLGNAPMLFDGSPPSTSMWERPMQHRLFQQPAYDASNPFDVRSEDADAGGSSSDEHGGGGGGEGEGADGASDDSFEKTTLGDAGPMEMMFLNGICCNDEELEDDTQLSIPTTPTSFTSTAPPPTLSTVIGLSEVAGAASVPLSATPPTIGFAGSDTGTASSLDSGVEMPAGGVRAACLPEGHTLLHCARGGTHSRSGMPYPV